MLQTKHPLSIVTVDYSNLFHSGLRALSASPIVDSTKPSSLLGSQSSGAQFWSYKTNSDSQEPTSQWADVSLVSGSDASFEWTHGVRSPEAEDVWMVSKSLSDGGMLISLDPLAPSPGPPSSFFIDLFDASSSTDSSPSIFEDEQDESFLSLSVPAESKHPYARIHAAEAQTSRRSSISTIEQITDDSWLYGLDSKSPSESINGRLDAVLHSVAEADSYHHGTNDDWRQFHADWIRDQQILSSLPPSPL